MIVAISNICISEGVLEVKARLHVSMQPLGALLLEECRVEREDSQAFSIGGCTSSM